MFNLVLLWCIVVYCTVLYCDSVAVAVAVALGLYALDLYNDYMKSTLVGPEMKYGSTEYALYSNFGGMRQYY